MRCKIRGKRMSKFMQKNLYIITTIMTILSTAKAGIFTGFATIDNIVIIVVKK